MRDERGGASLMVVVMVGVLMLSAIAAVYVVAVVRTHRIAQSAADLAAIAGAQAVQQGQDGCGAAQSVATGNGAAVAGCVVRGSELELELEVTVDGPRWRGYRPVLRARARAGPVGPGRAGSLDAPR